MRFQLSTLALAQSLAASGALGAALPAAAPPASGEPPVIYRAVYARQASVPATALTPSLKINLTYAADSGAQPINGIGDGASPAVPADTATVNGNMKLPSIVLETIGSASATCTKGSIKVSLTDAAEYAEAKKWPTKDVVMITNDQNGCASSGERGVYVVTGATFDDASKTATVAVTASTLQDQLADVDIDFSASSANAAARRAKRGLDIHLGADLSGKNLTVGPVSIEAPVATYTGDIKLKGNLKFNFLKFKLTALGVDLTYDSKLNMNLTTTVTAEADIASFDVTPIDQTVSAFSIPGILDVGPMLSFAVGVEIGVSGTMVVETGLSVEFTDSTVHLDFLDSSKSTATNWKPAASIDNKLSAQAALSISPYAALTAGLGVKAFGDKVDLTASVEAKPALVNTFNVAATVAYSSKVSKVTFVAPTNEATCPNGAWFASTLAFDVTASVGTLYTASLFSTELPIYESQCWSFVGKRDELPAIAAY